VGIHATRHTGRTRFPLSVHQPGWNTVPTSDRGLVHRFSYSAVDLEAVYQPHQPFVLRLLKSLLDLEKCWAPEVGTGWYTEPKSSVIDNDLGRVPTGKKVGTPGWNTVLTTRSVAATATTPQEAL
jgi:hypothetical protein